MFATTTTGPHRPYGASPRQARCPGCRGTRAHKFSCSTRHLGLTDPDTAPAAPLPGHPRPVLLLDIDGPLIIDTLTDAHRADGFEDHSTRGVHIVLRRSTGADLLTLAREAGLDLAWCSLWGHAANEIIAPLLDLPALPVVPITTRSTPADDWRVSIKARDVLSATATTATTAGRPFAWLDDEITGHDDDWLHRHGAGPRLLRRVESTTGLTHADLDAVKTWAAALTPPANTTTDAS